MKGKYVKRIGGLIFAFLMLVTIPWVSASTTEAQTRSRIIVRQAPVVVYRPYRYRTWWYDPYYRWGYYPFNRWGYDPWSPYGSYYRQYVFNTSESAVSQGYNDGFKTGKDDGKKAKSFNPERSHYYRDSGFGNYAEVYRSGFSRGYRDGYRLGSNQRAV